ncbi:response regulator transcription factor [Niabella sp. CJ426]|uniref:response regulator transcription factor n=1 Tax=Niabella sp. CJ426 TaxID=3393740 RepID=UPI003D076D13
MKIQTVLSNREFEVASLLVRGLLKKQVADKLKISVNTVRNHTTSIYEKLTVTSIGELCWLWRSVDNHGNTPKLFTPMMAPKRFERKRRARQYEPIFR